MTLPEDRRHLFDRFTLVDLVRQVVGVGSVGMRVYLVLLEGRSGDDPLFLQIKQAGPSVYESHLGPSHHDNHGARVIAGKRALQSATDIFVGWGFVPGPGLLCAAVPRHEDRPRHRSCSPPSWSSSPPPAARRWPGPTPARETPWRSAPTSARAPSSSPPCRDFARRYADQTERDHAQLQRAIAAGTVERRTGLVVSPRGLNPRVNPTAVRQGPGSIAFRWLRSWRNVRIWPFGRGYEGATSSDTAFLGCGRRAWSN